MDSTTTTLKSPTYFDSDFCGRVPLHQTNLVQPHGVLLVLRKDDLGIVQASENAISYLGLPQHTSVLSLSLQPYLNPHSAALMAEHTGKSWEGKLPLYLTVEGKPFLALLQQKPEYLIAEIEREGNAKDDVLTAFENLKFSIAAIEKANTIKDACVIAVRELQRISGFDKVMAYQFDEEWNGTVLAEATSEGMDQYIGLRFPASDIPAQARALYQRNTYRLIPNIDGPAPVKLQPTLNPITHTFTDLTDCNLRSVAPVHVQYLRNMKVQASMSTRILAEGKLWGLIACHHRTAKYVDYQTCSVFELLSVVIGAKINALQSSTAFDFRNKQAALLNDFKEDAYRTNNPVQSLEAQIEKVRELLSASGVAICFGKNIVLHGSTPDANAVKAILFWVQSMGLKSTYNQRSLVSQLDEAELYADRASGLLVLPIWPDKGFYILGFRPEEVEEVQWSGNPEERIIFERDQKNYHPRNSFKVWQQTVRKRAAAWTPLQLETAEQLRSFVIEHTLNKS